MTPLHRRTTPTTSTSCQGASRPAIEGGGTRPLTATVQRFLDGRSETLDVPRPSGETDELLALLEILDVWTAPLDRLGQRVVHQGTPAVVALKRQLEGAFVERLQARCPESEAPTEAPAAAMRRIGAASALPEVYTWLAESASWDELVHFLALEGGPDTAGFDDLVAMVQVGIRGEPKLCLAANYWDEMGRGDLGAVHTELHADLARAIEMYDTPAPVSPSALSSVWPSGGCWSPTGCTSPRRSVPWASWSCKPGPGAAPWCGPWNAWTPPTAPSRSTSSTPPPTLATGRTGSTRSSNPCPPRPSGPRGWSAAPAGAARSTAGSSPRRSPSSRAPRRRSAPRVPALRAG